MRRAVRQFSLASAAVRRRWKPEANRRALVHRRLRFDLATVPFHDALYRGQADAMPRKFVLAMQADERLEETAGMRHVEARAVVGHAIPGAAVALLGVEADLAVVDAAGVLP